MQVYRGQGLKVGAAGSLPASPALGLGDCRRLRVGQCKRPHPRADSGSHTPRRVWVTQTRTRRARVSTHVQACHRTRVSEVPSPHVVLPCPSPHKPPGSSPTSCRLTCDPFWNSCCHFFTSPYFRANDFCPAWGRVSRETGRSFSRAESL